MALERNNPLPPNARYWVDVSPSDTPGFNAWLASYRNAVAVVSSKLDPSNGWTWVLFETTAPLVWWQGPGYPTRADATVQTEADVKTIPHVESASEQLAALGESVSAAASSGGTKLAIAGVSILLAAVLLTRVLR